MRIDDRTRDGVAVLAPQGRLTIETFGELKGRVSRLAESGIRCVVLDLAAVTYVDSIGVAELVRIHTMLTRGGGRLALSGLHRAVDELLTLTHLKDIFAVYPGEDAAVRGISTDRPVD